MDISYQLLQGLLLATTAVIFTASMSCDKLILTSSGSKVSNDILEMGKYIVRTNQRTNSAAVKDLMSKLNGATDIQQKHKSFTATLQPKDLKKVQ